MELTVENHPQLEYLFDPLWNYEHNTELVSFDELAGDLSVYDGTGFSPENVYVKKNADGNDVFCIVDETGEEICYDTDYHGQGSVPAFHGTWCGGQSKNNTVPSSVLDTICMAHDYDYATAGYFDISSDLKFANRCRGQFQNMTFLERQTAKASCLYFGTVGYTLSLFKKKLPSNVDTQMTTQSETDVFYSLTGEQSPLKRMRFYQGLRAGLSQTMNTQNSPSASCNVKQIDYTSQFDALPVVWVA